MKKYEFVPGDEKVIAPGRTVKRIDRKSVV